MERPPSVLLFERLYLAAFVVSVAFALLNWSHDLAAVIANPGLARITGAARLLPVVYPLTRALIWGVWLLLWFLVARRASRVARVLVTIGALVTAYDGSRLLLAMLSGPLAGWAATVALIETALVVCAAAMLFRPDAKAWFAGARGASAA